MTTITSEENQVPDADSGTPEAQADGAGSREIWLRLLFMFVFVCLYGVSRVVVSAVVVLQFFWVLFTRKPQQRLGEFGLSLATYTYQIIAYLTFNSEERPFPIDRNWPQGAPDGAAA